MIQDLLVSDCCHTLVVDFNELTKYMEQDTAQQF